VLGTCISCAKMAELIEMPLGAKLALASKLITWGQIPRKKRWFYIFLASNPVSRKVDSCFN